MKTDFLPKNIEWISVESIPSSGYQEVLIAMNKHSKEDWYIVMGCIYPYDNYTKFKILARVHGMTDSKWVTEIEKKDVLAIGKFCQYGYVKDKNE